MPGRLHGSLSTIERVPVARYAYVVLLVIVGGVLLQIHWNDTGASTSVFHTRLFLLGAALVFAIVAATLALVPWWEQVRAWLIASHLLIMGLYLGLAVATTDWSIWSLSGWWQGWWTPVFLVAQIQQVLKLTRFSA